jgi:outer membrane protein TolC
MTDLYPHISIVGSFGYSAEYFDDLFRSSAMTGSIGPTFQWNILNYGRIRNNIDYQDARFRELVTAYQSTVLKAAQDVENGLVTFLRAQQRITAQSAAVKDSQEAVQIGLAQYKGGKILFTQVTQLEQTLVGQEDTFAQARNEAVAGLIQVYRALGGGWQVRLNDCPEAGLQAQPPSTPTAESVPTPRPDPTAVPDEKATIRTGIR